MRRHQHWLLRGASRAGPTSWMPILVRMLAWSLAWSSALCVGRASAVEAPRGPALNWVRLPGAEACIAAPELAQRVEERLARAVFVVDSQALLTLDGVVQPSGSGFTARIALSDRDGRMLGERTLQTAQPACRELDDALVLVIALTLSPERSVLGQGGIALDETTDRMLHELFRHEPPVLDATELPAVAAASEQHATTQPARDAPPPRQPTAATSDDSLVTATVAAIVAFGQLPAIAPGIEVAVSLSPRGIWPVRISAAYLPEQGARPATLSAGETGFQLSQASLGVCPWQTLAASFQIQFCAGVATGWLHVVSRGYASRTAERTDLLLDGLAQLDAQLRSGSVVVQLGAGVAMPMVQRRYTYQDIDGESEPLFGIPQLSARLGAGLGVGF